MKILVWKIGHMGDNPEAFVMPTMDTIDRFKDIIKNLKIDEINNIVWGPDLSVEIIDTGDDCSIEHVVL